MAPNNTKKTMRISKLPFPLLLRYLASGFIRFRPRPFRQPQPGAVRKG